MKVACDKVPRLAGVKMSNSNTDGAKRRRLGLAGVDARKLPDLCKTKKIGQDRLTSAIFISTIGMQSIATTAGVRIGQRHGQVVAAEKPGESAAGDGFPLGIAI